MQLNIVNDSFFFLQMVNDTIQMSEISLVIRL